MLDDLRFAQNRKRAFAGLARERIGEFKPDTFMGIVEYVLSDQQEHGDWSHEGQKWGPVKTAVVLRGLSRFGFTTDDTWAFVHNNRSIRGGVKKAIDYLDKELGPHASTTVGEDIWDHCQVLLALAAFDKTRGKFAHARHVGEQWESLHKATSSIQWAGPAYLSAIIDVACAYELKDIAIGEMVVALLAEQVKAGDPDDGMFRSTGDIKRMNLWNTALVLRTLCSAPSVPDDAIIRAVNWLLGAVGNKGFTESDIGNAPMFVARSLESLLAAHSRVSRECTAKIDQALVDGNRRLDGYWEQRKSTKQGTLKAYTAVLEYLSALTLPVPFGVLWYAAESIRKEDESKGRPIDVPGGWKAAWLSDLHEASRVPPGFFNPRRWVAGSMYSSMNRLTEWFQLQNLQAILSHVATLHPMHILVTGDLTNLAVPTQFNTVRTLFLELQKQLGKDPKVLDADLWTIIPGNHDVRRQKARFDNRKHIGTFLEYFGELYAPASATEVTDPFPHVKIQSMTESPVNIRLICLDSNKRLPVWFLGPNAKGTIDEQQIQGLTQKFAESDGHDMVLVVLHHHPVTIPQIIPDLQNYFLSLKPSVARRLIAVCAAQKVAALLHGHFHVYSDWSTAIGHGERRMSIIGAPCGTMGTPGLNVEFLELREAVRAAPNGVEVGLAVYSHQLSETGWPDPKYRTFISSGIVEKVEAQSRTSV